MTRRHFLLAASGVALGAASGSAKSHDAPKARVMTVTGPIDPALMGTTLPHEHVMCDFAGADVTGRHRWDVETVVRTMKPYLAGLRAAGCRTFVDCSPDYIGRDPRVLVRLSREIDLGILTNTGYYGAADDKFVPAHARIETVDQLARRWADEWRHGIEGTGVRPGFIKIGIDTQPLSDIDAKLVRAAARAHLVTGLTVACHTGGGTMTAADRDASAREQMGLLAEEGVAASAWIWVHANGGTPAGHLAVARAGGWVELDGYAPGTEDEYARMVLAMRNGGQLGRVLLSQDAGWYTVGEPGGGQVRPYAPLLTTLVPALRRAGLTEDDVRRVTVANPASAFTIGIRRVRRL